METPEEIDEMSCGNRYRGIEGENGAETRRGRTTREYFVRFVEFLSAL